MYLFDTDTLSNLMRPIARNTLVIKFASVPQEQQFTSSITLGEMIFGAYRSQERTEVLLQQIAEVMRPNLLILPFDEAAARRYGEVRAELERRGTPIGDADIRIAAIALTRGLIVVAGNIRHFGRVPGLAVENWLS